MPLLTEWHLASIVAGARVYQEAGRGAPQGVGVQHRTATYAACTLHARCVHASIHHTSPQFLTSATCLGT
mgnify:CR=1 FL=1